MENNRLRRRAVGVAFLLIMALFRCARLNDDNSREPSDAYVPPVLIADRTTTTVTSAIPASGPYSTESSEPNGGANKPTNGDGDEMMDVFWRYIDAYVLDDFDTYRDLHSAACRDEYSVADFTLFILQDSTLFESIFDEDPRFLEIGEPEVSEVDDRATVTYQRFGHEGQEILPPKVTEMVRENGSWFVDSCDFGRLLGHSPATTPSTAN